MKAPNSEQVAVAWLNWLPDLDAPAATNRPEGTTWSATGFAVASVVGDGGPRDVTYSVPVIGVDAWAVSPGSGKPPWSHAAGLTQIIRKAAVLFSGSVRLDMPAGYAPVLVTTAFPVSEIRRVPEPEGSSYAHYAVDIALGWVEVPT